MCNTGWRLRIDILPYPHDSSCVDSFYPFLSLICGSQRHDSCDAKKTARFGQPLYAINWIGMLKESPKSSALEFRMKCILPKLLPKLFGTRSTHKPLENIKCFVDHNRKTFKRFRYSVRSKEKFHSYTI